MTGLRLLLYVYSPGIAWVLWCLGPRRWLIERRAKKRAVVVMFPRYHESERV